MFFCIDIKYTVISYQEIGFKGSIRYVKYVSINAFDIATNSASCRQDISIVSENACCSSDMRTNFNAKIPKQIISQAV